MNIFQCHDIQILVFSWENVFKNVVCNNAAIFFWPQYVNNEIHVMRLLPFLPTVLIASRWSNRQIIDPGSLATHRSKYLVYSWCWLVAFTFTVDWLPSRAVKRSPAALRTPICSGHCTWFHEDNTCVTRGYVFHTLLRSDRLDFLERKTSYECSQCHNNTSTYTLMAVLWRPWNGSPWVLFRAREVTPAMWQCVGAV